MVLILSGYLIITINTVLVVSAPVFLRHDVTDLFDPANKTNASSHEVDKNDSLTLSYPRKCDIFSAYTPSIPPKPDKKMLSTLKPSFEGTQDPETQVIINLERNLFDNSHGEILYWSIFVGTEPKMERSLCGFWDGKKWPKYERWFQNIENMYEVTPIRWNPFNNVEYQHIVYTLGSGKCEHNYCNGALMSGTPYGFKVRAFTAKGYQDTDIVFFRTKRSLTVGIITSSVVFIIVLIMFIVLFLYVTNAYQRFNWLRSMKSRDADKLKSQSIPKKNFVSYTEQLLESQERISDEFQALTTRATEDVKPTWSANQPENRPKNRYINILPYDDNRVVLPMLEGDSSSDYINASYIKGFSEQVEYIASQGPKEDTCFDFWRMIIHDRVRCIFMLTSLHEKSTEKCFKYYPDLKQTLNFDEITLTCTEIKEKEIYVKRIIKITWTNNNVEDNLIVTHYHVTRWSDFGCPENTEIMLQLCGKARKYNAISKLLVHCSAGVGRTGTMIAVDVLSQTCRNKSVINVFETVLRLRKQRMNMLASCECMDMASIVRVQ